MDMMLFIGGDFKDKELIKEHKDLFDKHTGKELTKLVLREIEGDFKNRTGREIKIEAIIDDMPRLEIDFLKK